MFRFFKQDISFFTIRALLLCSILFSFHWTEAQTEGDSISHLLKKVEGAPLEQWEILAPFLREKAGDWDGSYLNYADTLLQLAKDHLPNKLAEAYSILGELHFNHIDLDKSLGAFQNGLQHIEKSDNPLTGIKIFRGIGNIFYRQEQHDQARDYFLQALNLALAHSDTLYEALCHLSLANIFVDELNFDSSAYHLYQAKDLAEAANLTAQLPNIYNNIFFLEDERGNFEYARSYIYKLLSLAEEIDDKNSLLLGYGNLGYSFGKYEQAYDSAIFYLKLGLRHFDPEFSEIEYLPEFYQAIADNYSKKGSPDSSLVYLQKYIELHDSIQQKQFNKGVQEIEAKYQTEEKQKQLIQAQLETERQTNLRQLTIGVALTVIALLFAFFQYFQNRQERKRRQTELSLKLKETEAQQLRELDQLKSNFFANISHEFRTPLTLILGPLEQLKNKQWSGNIHQYASMMHRNAIRLKELINQLLDLSKLESGQMQLKVEEGDIFQFSRQLISSFESWAMQKELHYQFEIPAAPLWVQYDRDKYEKILSNLISNAIKHTPDEGRVAILLKSEQIADSIKLKGYIKNSGFGIPEAEQEKVFHRFYQSNQSEDGTASSGIGLALTKELIELYGGSIHLTSTQGEFTEFSFELPMAPGTMHSAGPLTKDRREYEVNMPSEDQSFTAGDSLFSSKDKKSMVLVVEDNADVRHYIIEQIKDQYQILQASNGQEGLDTAFAKIPDLIITDLMMPKMTGHELVRQLKTDERTSHIPVIMLTAKADQQDKLEGLETGADDYLTKPFNAAELQVRVKNLITQRQLLKARYSKAGKPLLPKEIAVNSVDEQFLNRLLEFLETEIDNEQLSVEGLARMIGMSRSQLHRKLTALTDQTPIVFIRTFRMQRAQQLLLQKAGNVSEIAFMVGFSSLAYFSKCYKNEFGISPTEVLKVE